MDRSEELLSFRSNLDPDSLTESKIFRVISDTLFDLLSSTEQQV